MDKNIDAYKEEIRRTFELVKPIATDAAGIFYSTLWEIDPSTKVRLCTIRYTRYIYQYYITAVTAVRTLLIPVRHIIYLVCIIVFSLFFAVMLSKLE